MMTPPLPLIFEMETSDPDDFLTLLWLSDHPGVDLRAVLVTPGGLDQCRLVRWALDNVGKADVPLGVFRLELDDGKLRVSKFHYKIYGDALRTHDPGHLQYGPDLVGRLLADPQANVTYLAGSAPKNLGQAHRHFGELRLARWVQQGFFAGDNVVPENDRLEKFKGRVTCPSFNPGGDPKSCLELLASDRVRRRVCVSKNVCHGVIWTREMHQALLLRLADSREELDETARPGLRTMIHGLDCYLRDKGVGKAMHDILAAAVALDERVVTLREVEVYRKGGEWGACVAPGTRTWISVAYDPQCFLEVLAQ